MKLERLSGIAFRMLSFFCPVHLYEEIEGDLSQKLERDIKMYGRRKAGRKLIWNVIRFFRPGIVLRNRFSIELNHFYMLQNYFSIAYRHLMKSKTFSIINISGLSVGIAAFFMIVQYVSFEMSYDKGSEDVYRLAYRQSENGEVKTSSAQNLIGLRSLLKDFPEIKSYTGFSPIPNNNNFLFGYQGKIFSERGRDIRGDSAFFKVFSSLLTRGDASTALKDPHSIVLAESVVKKVFGNDTDPIGLFLDDPGDENHKPFIITGVFKDLPENSHFHAGFVTPLSKYDGWDAIPNYWNGPDYYTYIKIKDGADISAIEQRLNRLLEKLERDHPQVKGSRVIIQSVPDIHLNSHFKDELEANGNKAIVYSLSAIGLLILAMAWINYVNIETARFISRAKEVSIRRVIGSRKSDLALQFLVEYFCVNIFAIASAFLFIKIALPGFGYLTGIPIDHFVFSTPAVWIISFGCFIVGSLVAGLYPTLFVLRFDPIASLKGNFSGSSRGGATRMTLITIQFASSLILMTFLLIVYRQLEFMRITNKKIDLEEVVAVRNPTAYTNQEDSIRYGEYSGFRNLLAANPSIKSVASSSALPGTEIGFTFVNLLKRNLSDPYDPTRFKMLFIDYNFIPLYDLKLKAGRNYSVSDGDEEDWTTVILNERAIHALGFATAQDAVDQMVYLHLWKDDFEKYKIVGVVEDYHHEAVKKEVNPTIFSLNHGKFQLVFYSIRLNPGTDIQAALTYIDKAWKDMFPTKPIDYFFIDDYYDRQFKSEQHMERIFTVFAGVALFISCLGVLGMTLFESNSRLKEISIRKVLGATLSSLLALLSRRYLRLILIAGLVSIPVTYYSAVEWLNDYPSRIPLNVLFFLLPLAATVLLVTVVSAFQTVRAATSNPVDNLKYE